MEIYYHIIIYGTIFLCLLMAVAMLFLFQYQKKHKNFIDQQNNFQQTLLQSQLEIQEKTLKNISQEIHDNIGQVLSLVKLNLYTMDINDQDALSTKIDNSKELVSKAITDLRDLSHSMNTDYIEEKGLTQAIASELDIIRKSGTLQTKLEVIGEIRSFDKKKELIIFRIMQETFQNIIKHADAKNIIVVIKQDQFNIEVKVVDDGKGFFYDEFDKSPANTGSGLTNMKRRAEFIDCSISFSQLGDSGTVVKLVYPIRNNYQL